MRVFIMDDEKKSLTKVKFQSRISFFYKFKGLNYFYYNIEVFKNVLIFLLKFLKISHPLTE